MINQFEKKGVLLRRPWPFFYGKSSNADLKKKNNVLYQKKQSSAYRNILVKVLDFLYIEFFFLFQNTTNTFYKSLVTGTLLLNSEHSLSSGTHPSIKEKTFDLISCNLIIIFERSWIASALAFFLAAFSSMSALRNLNKI